MTALLVWVASLAVAPYCLAESPEDVQAVWRQTQVLKHKVDQLRRYMGARVSRELLFDATNVQTHDIHAQALEFHRKSARLRFEHLRELATNPPPPSGDTDLEDTIAVLKSSQSFIQEVMDFYRLPGIPPSATDSYSEARPRDVFYAVRSTGRQLDLLLDQQVNPSDTYMTVVQAIANASSLLATFKSAERIPAEPAYQPDKTPRDVWVVLLLCLERTETIYANAGLEPLHISVRDDASAEILPVDVNDLAHLLADRLAFVVTMTSGAQQPMIPVYPGRRFPSHVYGKASVLQTQLNELQRLMQQGSQ